MKTMRVLAMLFLLGGLLSLSGCVCEKNYYGHDGGYRSSCDYRGCGYRHGEGKHHCGECDRHECLKLRCH